MILHFISLQRWKLWWLKTSKGTTLNSTLKFSVVDRWHLRTILCLMFLVRRTLSKKFAHLATIRSSRLVYVNFFLKYILFFKVTGLKNNGQAISILLRGSSKLVLDESERSLHDALCVIRCLVKKRALLPGLLYYLYFVAFTLIFRWRCTRDGSCSVIAQSRAEKAGGWAILLESEFIF